MKKKKQEKQPLPTIKSEIKNSTQKGYNEKNPTQPQGAFTADSNSGKNPGL